MKFEMHYHDGFFELKKYGDAELGKIKEALDLLVGHEKWKPGNLILMDYSETNGAALSVTEIKYIAANYVRLRAEFGRARMAILVSRDVGYGLFRMWQVFVASKWDVVNQIFRSRDEAISWLKEV